MTQHAGLTVERWAGFPHPQRILMIANEMNRARRLMGPDDAASRRLAYERVLRLTDLTITAAERRAVRREMLRWRDVVAALFLAAEAEPANHDTAMRVLLQQTPSSAEQLAYLT